MGDYYFKKLIFLWSICFHIANKKSFCSSDRVHVDALSSGKQCYKKLYHWPTKQNNLNINWVLYVIVLYLLQISSWFSTKYQFFYKKLCKKFQINQVKQFFFKVCSKTKRNLMYNVPHVCNVSWFLTLRRNLNLLRIHLRENIHIKFSINISGNAFFLK